MKWTPDKDALLIELWPDMGQKCLPMFPGSTAKALHNRANVLGVKRSTWTGRKPAQKKEPPKFQRIRVEFFDDEPLVLKKHDRRQAVSCFGFLRTGPVPSVFHLAREA